MELHEAILLGLGEIRFTNSLFLNQSPTTGECMGCLAGAALFAAGHRDGAKVGEKMEELWPWTIEFRTKSWICPFCKGKEDLSGWGIVAICTHLADHYETRKITAEQIADHIKSLEPVSLKESPVQSEEKVSVTA